MGSYDEFIRETIAEQSREEVLRRVKKNIWVTFQKEGIHKYPDAPDEVDFLRYPHRHIFKFKVQIEVYNDDRDIEFFIFKRWLESLYADDTLQLDYKSCEMMADDLAKQIKDKYPGRQLSIDVSEDGENGCHVEYPKEY
jgi:hypothetical protein|tara:strand:- start:389 stop:805 length:417 start_codon:yes stop_codon:yes gene_type:complete